MRGLNTSGLCPCCGQALPPATFQWVRESSTFVCDAGSLRFARMHAAIFDYLWSNNGATSIGRLADHVWQLDPNGGPDGGSQLLSVHMSRMRRLLEPLGYTLGVKVDNYRLTKYAPK